MATNVQEAGTILWKLRADLKGFDKDLAQAQESLDTTVEKGSEKLDLFQGKFLLLGAAAIGAAYMMIKASPSLSFGMQEIAYRFEYIAAVIGEEFAPILEDVLIPALDELIPLVEEIAPEIGEMVTNVIDGLEPLSPEFDRVVDLVGGTLDRLFTKATDPKYEDMFDDVVTALGGIADSALDIAEPAIDAFFDILELLEPFITTTFIVTLGALNDAFEFLAGFVGDVIAELEGDEQLMALFEQFGGILNDDVIPAIETLGGYLEDLTDWLEESGRLDIAVRNAVTVIGWYGTGLTLVADEIERTISKIQILIGWLEQLPWNKIQEILYGANLFGTGPIFAPQAQHGGRIVRGGVIQAHAGEVILSAPDVSAVDRGGGRGGGVDIDRIEINIPVGSISSSMDIRRVAQQTATELKYQLERKVFI